jgi:uncharacterized membrane protein
MMQEIIVLIVFAAALFYLGRLAYRSFSKDSSCPKGCGSCDAVDFKKIQEQIRKKEKEQDEVSA